MSDRIPGTWDVQVTPDLVVATWTPDEKGMAPVVLNFLAPEARTLGEQLLDGERAARGWEQVHTPASELQHGDVIFGMNTYVDYILLIGAKGTEVGVWSNGSCVVTFRYPEWEVSVLRKIQ